VPLRFRFLLPATFYSRATQDLCRILAVPVFCTLLTPAVSVLVHSPLGFAACLRSLARYSSCCSASTAFLLLYRCGLSPRSSFTILDGSAHFSSYASPLAHATDSGLVSFRISSWMRVHSSGYTRWFRVVTRTQLSLSCWTTPGSFMPFCHHASAHNILSVSARITRTRFGLAFFSSTSRSLPAAFVPVFRTFLWARSCSCGLSRRHTHCCSVRLCAVADYRHFTSCLPPTPFRRSFAGLRVYLSTIWFPAARHITRCRVRDGF